jgi:hypothetical protein
MIKVKIFPLLRLNINVTGNSGSNPEQVHRDKFFVCQRINLATQQEVWGPLWHWVTWAWAKHLLRALLVEDCNKEFLNETRDIIVENWLFSSSSYMFVNVSLGSTELN